MIDVKNDWPLSEEKQKSIIAKAKEISLKQLKSIDFDKIPRYLAFNMSVKFGNIAAPPCKYTMDFESYFLNRVVRTMTYAVIFDRCKGG